MARSPKSDFKSRVLAFAQVSLKKKKKKEGEKQTMKELKQWNILYWNDVKTITVMFLCGNKNKNYIYYNCNLINIYIHLGRSGRL